MADYSRLPGPNADLWDWQLRGLCRGKDSSLFFHPEGERGAARAAREQSAKEICLNCPVQKQCCEHALRVREPYGVWGGMTEEEREAHYQRQKALMRARAVREKAALAEKAKLKEKLLRDRERELARLAKAQENTDARGRGPLETAAPASAPASAQAAAPVAPAERMTPAPQAAAATAPAEPERALAPEPLAAAERMAPVEHENPADAMVPADAARPLSKVAPPKRPAGRAVAPAKKIPAAAPRKRSAAKVPESV
jgi:WhiB family redox-sensing transcriptional regulator